MDKLIGTLPDGTEEEFSSEEDYENEFYDMLFDMQGDEVIDWPEDWVA